MAENTEAKWYVVHTYSGYENKVMSQLQKVVDNRGLHEMIQEISVPVDEIVEIKDGKKKTSFRKRFPGYVFVKMIFNEEMWYIIRNTTGVTGFVGPDATRPLPLTESDKVAMGIESDYKPEVDYAVGDTIRVTKGPFGEQVCVVEEMDYDKQQVKVRMTLFGRETLVSLDFTQVQKIDS